LIYPERRIRLLKVMKLRYKISIFNSIIKAKLFDIKIPIIISWAITMRCNYVCKYCNDRRVMASEDLDTEQVFSIIDKLVKTGTKIIVFTGGEPLLRDDLGRIVDYCADSGIITGVNSNGSLVKAKIAQLSNLNTLSLSLDGPEDINDSVRGTGSFRAVMDAIEAACSRGIKIKFLAVLSKFNCDFEYIDYLLDLAGRFNTTVTFQPAEQLFFRGGGLSPVCPPEEEYKAAINYLISEKRRNKNNHIGNSLSGLKYLGNWPGPRKIKCTGILSRIDNRGNVMFCGRFNNPWKGKNCLNMNFNEVFLESQRIDCDCCWCASRVEMNYLFSFKPDVILNMKKIIR